MTTARGIQNHIHHSPLSKNKHGKLFETEVFLEEKNESPEGTSTIDGNVLGLINPASYGGLNCEGIAN
jgi:hypothetical protein